MAVLLKDPQLSNFHIDYEQTFLRFWVNREDFMSAAARVNELISRFENKSQPVVSQPQPQPQHQSGNTLTRDLDSMVVEALKSLMKEDFRKISTQQTEGGGVTVCCHGPTAQDTMNQIDSLRQEEVQLADGDFDKFTDALDTTPEGVAAYLIPVRKQGKVVIFSFDYNALSKAKHLLNVKVGKIRVTGRGRRRFDGRNPETDHGSINQSPPSSLGYGSSDFTTKSGIRVSVYKTDITKLPVEAIVNAANEHLAHGGGVAYAIARSAGFSLEDEGQDYILKHGPLKVKQVVATTGGSLPCKKVLHAVGPRWYDYKDKLQCQADLTDTVYNCLCKAESMQIASLAIPSISSGQ